MVPVICASEFHATGLQRSYNSTAVNVMNSNYTWDTVKELIMLGILASINVSYLNAAKPDPSKWVVTEIYNGNTLGISNDSI